MALHRPIDLAARYRKLTHYPPLLPLGNKQTAFAGALGNLSISLVSNLVRTRAPHIPASAAPVSCGS